MQHTNATPPCTQLTQHSRTLKNNIALHLAICKLAWRTIYIFKNSLVYATASTKNIINMCKFFLLCEIYEYICFGPGLWIRILFFVDLNLDPQLCFGICFFLFYSADAAHATAGAG